MSLPIVPTEKSGIASTGTSIEVQELARHSAAETLPVLQSSKGEIRKVRGGFQGMWPKSGASGPKKESHDEALRAWNGKANQLPENTLASRRAISDPDSPNQGHKAQDSKPGLGTL